MIVGLHYFQFFSEKQSKAIYHDPLSVLVMELCYLLCNYCISIFNSANDSVGEILNCKKVSYKIVLV